MRGIANIIFYGKENDDFRIIRKVVNDILAKQFRCYLFSRHEGIMNHIKYFSDEQNVFFLKVEMDSISGIEVARKIRKYDKKSLIIFIAGNNYHMESAFQFNTFDYLLEPLNQDEMKNFFMRMME